MITRFNLDINGPFGSPCSSTRHRGLPLRSMVAPLPLHRSPTKRKKNTKLRAMFAPMKRSHSSPHTGATPSQSRPGASKDEILGPPGSQLRWRTSRWARASRILAARDEGGRRWWKWGSGGLNWKFLQWNKHGSGWKAALKSHGMTVIQRPNRWCYPGKHNEFRECTMLHMRCL